MATTLLYAPFSLLHLLIAACALFGSAGLRNRAERRAYRAYASILIGLSGATAILLGLFDFWAVTTLGRDYNLLMPLAMLAAGALVIAVPWLAWRIERACRTRGGWLHAVAANPGWTIASLGGAVSLLTAPELGWLVLAPVLLIPLLAFDSPAEPTPLLAFDGLQERVPLVAFTPAPAPRPPPALPGVELARAALRTHDAHCPVCGERVTERACACALCQTPHHSECFAFNGRCAIYGCTSTRVLAN